MNAIDEKNIDFYEDHSFTGTEEYHRVTIIKKFLITDGALHMAEKLKCFWFMDMIASYLSELEKMGKDFSCIYFIKKDSGGIFTITGGNDKVLIEQEIEYTDITQNLRVFNIFDGSYWVALLPSEY